MRALLAHLRTFSAGPYARPALVGFILAGPFLFGMVLAVFMMHPVLLALLGLRLRPRVRIPAGRNP